MPRVGDSAFVNYVDTMHSANSVMVKVAHINNKNDPIPIVPRRFLGFAPGRRNLHTERLSSAWVACPGHDNPSQFFSVRDVPHLVQSDIWIIWARMALVCLWACVDRLTPEPE